MLNEELSADQYLTRYAEKLKNDQAIKDLVSLLVYLSGFHWELVSFVVNQVDMLVEDMVSADGTYDEYEWQRIALYNKLLGEALGIEIEPPKKPAEVKE